MMVNCPRCGFSQPQDQYCAQCGVDMVAYQPARKPFIRRLLGSTIFQLFALAAVLIVVFSYARQQRHKELAERIAEIESAHSTQTLSRHPANGGERTSSQRNSIAVAETPPQPQAEESQPTARDKTADAATSVPSETRLMETTASSNATAATSDENIAPKESPTPTTEASAQPQNARVTFAAASRAALAELINGADPSHTTSLGPVTTGVIAQSANKLRALQSTEYWEVLDSSSRSIKANQAIEFYGGQMDAAREFLGFMIELTPMEIGESETRINLRIWRYLREGGEVETFAIPLPETLDIPKSGGVFVTGSLLPRRPMAADERRLYDPLKVLHILATEPYRNNMTDLLILIEPR